MVENIADLTLSLLRRVDTKLDLLGQDVREVKNRLGILETQYASLSNRQDRLDDRIERIERRLEIADA
jgi:phage shock protein A